jgi:hypothetical protein
LVVTNITGHFSDAIQATSAALKVSFLYIICYLLGVFWAFSCFYLAQKNKKNWISALPILANLLIFLGVMFMPSLPVACLFVAMSTQNAFGIHFSSGNIRPSQITGILVSLGEDLAKYFFKNRNSLSGIYIKILNIMGFMLGGLLAFHWYSVAVLWIPILFYFFSVITILTNRSQS